MGLKYTQGFTQIGPSIWTIGSMAVSLMLLGVAMKSLPLGTAYAVWVGVGTVGTVILGVVLFKEPVNVIRVISVLLILAGLVGLKLGGTSSGWSGPASIVIEEEIS